MKTLLLCLALAGCNDTVTVYGADNELRLTVSHDSRGGDLQVNVTPGNPKVITLLLPVFLPYKTPTAEKCPDGPVRPL